MTLNNLPPGPILTRPWLLRIAHACAIGLAEVAGGLTLALFGLLMALSFAIWNWR